MISQFDLLIEIRNKLTETHEAIMDIREAKKQINGFTSKLNEEEHKDIIDFSKELTKNMDKIEKELYQTKNQSRQDPLNFPIKTKPSFTTIPINAMIPKKESILIGKP